MKIIELIAKGIGALFKFAFTLVGITFLTAQVEKVVVNNSIFYDWDNDIV